MVTPFRDNSWMYGRPLRHGPRRVRRRRGHRIQPGSQLLIIQLLRERPGQPGRPGPIQGFGRRAPRHPTTGGDLLVTASAGPFERQNVFDLSPCQVLRWHRHLSIKWKAYDTQDEEDVCREGLRHDSRHSTLVEEFSMGPEWSF